MASFVLFVVALYCYLHSLRSHQVETHLLRIVHNIDPICLEGSCVLWSVYWF